MKKKLFLVLLAAVFSLVLIGCSTDNSNGKTDPNMPQPKVRVELKPTATPSPTQIIEPTATPEAVTSPTPEWFYYDPTPDSDSLASQIESMMDEIDRKLKSENFQLK